MDINKEVVEKINRKSLGEDCWIDCGDFSVRVDYMSQSQELEFKRHMLAFEVDKSEGLKRHYIDYYLRATIKEIHGITIKGREAEKLEFINGLAMSLVTTDNKSPQEKVDMVGIFVELGLAFVIAGLIVEKLKFTEADKKKLQSAPDSAKKEISQEPGASSNLVQSSTLGKTKKSNASRLKKP